MIRSVKAIQKMDKVRYTVPKYTRDLICADAVYPDGIFKIGGNYSKTFMFTDINYCVASLEDKQRMFLSYCSILNSLDCGATTKITIANHAKNESDFESSVQMEMKNDGMDKLRSEYNEMLRQKLTCSNGKTQEKYITITAHKNSLDEARAYFSRISAELSVKFSALGSFFTSVDAEKKLKILKGFFRPEEEDMSHVSLLSLMRLGHDFRDTVMPDTVEKGADYIKLGSRYARVFYLKDYASFIRDDFITELTETNQDMMLSIDIIPTPTDEAVREIERRLLGVETNITNWQRKQNQNDNFSAVIPYDMELQRKEAKEFLDDLTTRDQRMMFAVITMVITAPSLDQLNERTEAVLSTGRKHMCQIACLKYQQLGALNTVLPIGVRKIDAFRTLTTESLAVFIPFKVQEIIEKGGIYLGENSVSGNVILCNRANLSNQSTIVLGIPGSGKSLCAKNIIWQILLNTDDDICICDPEGEYASMLKDLPQSMCSIVNMSAGGRDRLNAMYMVDGYGENNPIIVKSQFIMSLMEQIDKFDVGPKQKSLIDRCTAKVYEVAAKKGEEPTLCNLRQALMQQDEALAKEIALSMELYTEGSLNIFGHEGNVDMSRRILVFDIHALGSQLKSAGLLVITDTILNRVTSNFRQGKRTHVFIDEFHIVYQNEYSAEFFNSAWRQFRKRNAYPTAITQNVEYLLSSQNASSMLSNSECVIMLNQATSDREKLAKLLNISPEQMSFVTNSEPGCGLIRYGGALVPFENRFPKDTMLYSLMTTKPGEGTFSLSE